MRRVLWHHGTIPIYSYPVLLYLGTVAGMFAAYFAASRVGLDPGRVLLANVLLVAPGLAGARLLFVVSHWSLYRAQPARIWRRTDGGAALYGGLLAVPLSPPLLAVLGIPFLTFWDAAVFSVLTGMTFGRVGCLLHGCCSGRPSLRWFAIELPDHRGVRRRRVPTQILEAAWSALLLAGAGILSNHRPFSGALFLFSAGGYAAGRLLLESTREEAAERRGWTVHHRISAALAALSAAGLALIARLP